MIRTNLGLIGSNIRIQKRSLANSSWANVKTNEVRGEGQKYEISGSNKRNSGENAGEKKKKPKVTSAGYCMHLVRKHDYENYLCTLLLPDANHRRAVFAIRAFNTEVALVRDQVTQKELGLGRMFFWRDSLNQLYANKQSDTPYVPQHPVVIELNNALLDHNLSKKWMSNLVDSRERAMTDSPFKDLLELEAYCDQSITSLLYLNLELLGVKNIEVDHAASHIGKAIGLCNFIRSIPFNAQRRRVLVPQDLLIKNKVSQESFVRNTELDQIQEVVFEIASYAHSHYEKAKSLKKHVSKQVLPVFLSGVPSLLYLKRLQKANFNPYEPSLNKRYGLLPFQLYYRKIIKSYC